MSLSTELARTLPRIPHPVLPKRKCALEIEADKAAQAFGGVAREPPPAIDMLGKVEAILKASDSGLGTLGRKELKVVPYLIWGSDPHWREDRTFIRGYLSVVNAKWPTGLRRLWRHYALNFDADSPATIEMAEWFHSRQERLPELLKSFTETYRLFDVAAAAQTMATAALRDEKLIQDIFAVGLTTAILRSSALCIATLGAAGPRLFAAPGTARVIERLRTLLDGKPENAIAEAICSEATRSKTVRALTNGLVEWQEGYDPKDANPDGVLDFLLALNGDPRFVPERWHGRVSDRSVAAMERWLSRKTFEAFFRVIDTLRTDRPDMWQGRRAFWLPYLPHVSKAWLVAGLDATPIAEKEGIRFGRFAPGGGTQNDHCGLMLQIRNTCVLEMNKNGSAIFWDSGARGLPGLYEESYLRSRYRNAADGRQIVVQTHQGDWQSKFRSRILQMTGVHVRER